MTGAFFENQRFVIHFSVSVLVHCPATMIWPSYESAKVSVFKSTPNLELGD